ncbi:MAG: HlyD family type I secretion periplasmic adaptor subunit [Bacteriovoracaceae bacterium]
MPFKEIKRKKEKYDQVKLLSKSTALEEGSIPFTVKTTILVISFFFLTFVIWALIFEVKETVKFNGRIIPSGDIKVISHKDSGKIQTVYVKEGDLVKKGDLLLVLDGSIIETDIARVDNRILLFSLQEERMKAFTENRIPDFTKIEASEKMKNNELNVYYGMQKSLIEELNVIKEQLNQKLENQEILNRKKKLGLKSYRISKEQWLLQKRLNKAGLSSNTQVLNANQERVFQWTEYSKIKDEISQNKIVIEEFKSKIASIDSKFKDRVLQSLSQVQQNILDTIQQKDRLKAQLKELEIYSPVSGIIQNLTANTVGTNIPVGKPMMEIYPDRETLVAEIKINPNDIGFIKPGMSVNIKVTAFDFSRYGSLDGKLKTISPSTIVDERDPNTAYYKGIVRLSKYYVGDKGNRLQSGMLITGDILSGSKTVMAYFLKPIHKALESSFGER